jgi:tetratricopeptide (TPR) repeat protein
MATNMQSIDELEQQIRDFINNPRKRHILSQDNAVWNLLCSCLDTIGDTELAINAYERSSNPPPTGVTYLLVYGLLQALFIQQDAVENLCQALVIDYVPQKLLVEIREIRNDSIGHPTKRGKNKGFAYNFIGRYSLAKEGFDLMTTYPDDTQPLFRHVSIESLIEGQRNVMQKVLTEVLGKLKEEEANHRAKYRDQKLEDVFPPTLSYYFHKMGSAIDGEPGGFGTMHIHLVAKVIEDFKERMDKRGALQAYASVVDLIKLIEYPIQELTAYFDDVTHSTLNVKSAHIFAFFVDKHIEELKSMAKEIDEDYKSEP